jgi:hypothetical protein
MKSSFYSESEEFGESGYPFSTSVNRFSLDGGEGRDAIAGLTDFERFFLEQKKRSFTPVASKTSKKPVMKP